jgi:hypothetical protein
MVAERQEVLQRIVEAALREHQPPVVVAGLRVLVQAGVPRILGRVASESDRDWAIGLARNAVGQEVHDGLEIDPAAAPRTSAGASSDYEAEGDAASHPHDRTQVDTDRRRAGMFTRRPPAGGESRVEEIRPDQEPPRPADKQDPRRPAAPEERPRRF